MIGVGRRGCPVFNQDKPWRASRTSVTASGKIVAITARICWACCSVVPWMLTRLIAATVMSTASLIALSAHASDWEACICSAISCMRRWKSGSLKKPPKPSMGSTVLVAEGVLLLREPLALRRLDQFARVLGLPLRHRAAQGGEGDGAGDDRKPE